MRVICILLQGLLLISCANGRERTFTGSTPAGKEARMFLGIPLTDSVDFIRWKIVLKDNDFDLSCNYGIGKPNTNGFYNGGNTIDFSGTARKDRNRYELRHGNYVLDLLELNEDLLHFIDFDNRLIPGNGGWSYTLNNTQPGRTKYVSLPGGKPDLRDSLVYVGRTPCGIPGVGAGDGCYKLKWKIVLYPDATRTGGTYIVYGSNWRKEHLTGNWTIINGEDGRITFQLNDEKGKGLIYLLKLPNIVLFTDAEGRLLVGDHDFSYTLNRI